VIIKILSQNANLGYVIGKNPKSPAKAVSIRKGWALGWFNGPTNYTMRFIDDNDEVSFPEHQNNTYEYLSPARYSSAMCGLSLLNEFVSKIYGENDTAAAKFVIASLHVKKRTHRTLSHYFPSCKFECLGYEDYYTVTIDGASVADCLNMAQNIMLFIALDNEHFYSDDGFITKYAKIVKDSPYFIKYLFKTQLLKSRSLFDKLVPIIQKDNEKFVFGVLNENRLKFVSENIGGGKVLDVGCGEGTYLKRFAKNTDLYVGVDIDPDQIAICEKHIKNRDLKNTYAFGTLDSIQDWDNFYADTVLIIEVIEHMEWEKVTPFLVAIRNQQPDAKFLITTPDVRFNQYYPVESRHEDHCWEKSPEEIQPLLSSIFKTVEYVPIGDSVCGVTPTQGYICYV
jgi:SAM-dependent methyltransferase